MQVSKVKCSNFDHNQVQNETQENALQLGNKFRLFIFCPTIILLDIRKQIDSEGKANVKI